MRKLVYNALEVFTKIEERLRNGERIITFECDLPDCIPNRGKIYFFKQQTGYVVGICDLQNHKTVQYLGGIDENRDLKFLVKHQAICYDNIPQIFNLFYRMDAIYSSTKDILTYYIDGYGYYHDGKYQFELLKKGGSWRAYILQMPSFEGRDDSSSATHRLTDGNRRYVCVQGNVETKTKMRQIAIAWANGEQRYIKTGQRF